MPNDLLATHSQVVDYLHMTSEDLSLLEVDLPPRLAASRKCNGGKLTSMSGNKRSTPGDSQQVRG